MTKFLWLWQIEPVGMAILTLCFAVLAGRLAYISGWHLWTRDVIIGVGLLALWLLASASHGLKRAYRWWMAAGAAGAIGISTKSVDEIFEKYETKRKTPPCRQRPLNQGKDRTKP